MPDVARFRVRREHYDTTRSRVAAATNETRSRCISDLVAERDALRELMK